MKMRSLGTGGPAVSAVGLGCMGMSGIYGPAAEADSLATIDAALEAGITMLDTGDFYGMGHNEMLVGRALQGRRDRVFLAVKFGAQRDPSGRGIGFDARPASVKTALSYTLQRLGTDHVDLYMPARLDPAVPIEDTVGAVAELIQAGYVRHLGLSEVGAQIIRRAHAVHQVAALQMEYSLMDRGVEREILPVVRELGIAVTAYGVVARGLLAGGGAASTEGEFRARAPRFQGENLALNQALGAALAALAAERGVTGAQLAIAWVASRGADIIPLIGTRRPERVAEAVTALDILLSPEELELIEASVPATAVAGTRYDARNMAALDSERAR